MKLFNGMDQYLSGTSALALPTFALSFSFQSTSAQESFLLSWDSAGYQIVLNPKGNIGKLSFKLWQSPTQVYSFQSLRNLNDGDCHHVAISYDGKQLNIYIDGVLVDDKGRFKTDQPVHYATGSSLMIGNDSKSGKGRGFQGKIDELRLYNRSLNLAEGGILKASKPVPPAFQIRFYDTKGLENKSTFVAIHSSEAKKVSFTHKSTKKELEQRKVKPAEYVPLLQLKLGIGEFAYKVE